MVAEARLITVIKARQSGASLQEIASRLGISRERVRQLLIKHRGSTKVQDLLSAAELAQQAGCSQAWIGKLRRRGVIEPAKVVGMKRTLWKPETTKTIMAFLASHRCRVCNRSLPDNHWVYCSQECYTEEVNRHRYKKLSEQAKKLHNEKVARWQRSHPEEARIIRRRGQRKYELKKSIERYKSTRYVIWKRCLIPLGTIVRIRGWGMSRSRLAAEWDDQVVEVPFGCVKRIAEQNQSVGLQS
jgi:transcriptional regulator with XRE-family HTH domain